MKNWSAGFWALLIAGLLAGMATMYALQRALADHDAEITFNGAAVTESGVADKGCFLKLGPGVCLDNDAHEYENDGNILPGDLPLDVTAAAFAKRHAPSVYHLTILTEDNGMPGAGSAVAISDDGLMLTDAHVVKGAVGIIATELLWLGEPKDGSRFDIGDQAVMRIARINEQVDVALLQPTDPMELADFAEPSFGQLQRGDPLYMIGASTDINYGHVLAPLLNAAFEDGRVGIQAAAWIPSASGDSGGPVFSPDGYLRGLVRGKVGRIMYFTRYEDVHRALNLRNLPR